MVFRHTIIDDQLTLFLRLFRKMGPEVYFIYQWCHLDLRNSDVFLSLFENAAEAAGKSPEKRGAASNRGDLTIGAYLIG